MRCTHEDQTRVKHVFRAARQVVHLNASMMSDVGTHCKAEGSRVLQRMMKKWRLGSGWRTPRRPRQKNWRRFIMMSANDEELDVRPPAKNPPKNG